MTRSPRSGFQIGGNSRQNVLKTGVLARDCRHRCVSDCVGARAAQQVTRSVCPLGPDGWPQATTVGYANDGLTLYFLCGPDSQKAANLARDDRVSLTIDHDTPQVMEITGLSMAARAKVVVDPTEGAKAFQLLTSKYPPQGSLPLPMPAPADIRIFRVTPIVVSVLDYSKGFVRAAKSKHEPYPRH